MREWVWRNDRCGVGSLSVERARWPRGCAINEYGWIWMHHGAELGAIVCRTGYMA